MQCKCNELTTRVDNIETNITELVELMEEVKGAFRFFIAAGKFIKWLSGILLAVSGIAWVINHFGGNPLGQ